MLRPATLLQYPHNYPIPNRLVVEIPNYKCVPVTMKKTFWFLSILSGALIGGALCLSCAALAVDPPQSTPNPALDVPPKIDPPEDSAPALTNLKKSSVKQTMQTTRNGEQTEVRVTNSIGTYIVKPNQSEGDSLPGDAQSKSNNSVQWIVKSWGGSKSSEGQDDVPPTLQKNPNPPASK